LIDLMPERYQERKIVKAKYRRLFFMSKGVTTMKFYLPLGAAAGLLALSGCVEPNDTSAEAPPPPPAVVYADQSAAPSETTYVPPGTYATAPSYPQDDYEDDGAPVPSEGEVEVDSVQDFDEPLQPYGEWIVVANYGRCWRPRHVEANWRPYCDGHWVDTDQGWYWESDEPWGWATYHYGRWDFQAGFGWYWIPRTRWAPAWVEWRTGGGYVGWAPLPPGARFDKDGHHFHEVHASDRNFVFVHENHFDQRVRPSTVVVNNTTIIHETKNITSITIVNNHVHNGGPRVDVVAKAMGHQVRPVPAVQLRRQIERPVATKHPMLTRPHGNRPANRNNANANNNNSPTRSTGPRGPIGNPAENHQPYGAPPTNQNHTQPRPATRSQNPNVPQSANPPAHSAPQMHPTPAPTHVNQPMHDLNAHPAMKPLHQDNKMNELHTAPTMKPLENHAAVHTPQTPRATTPPAHQAVPQPPQPRPQLPREQNPVIAPHNNPPSAVGPAQTHSAAVPQQSTPHQVAPQTAHPPPPQRAVPPRAAVQPKTPPPQQQHERRDDSPNQNQPQK
jgi:hypothetical protein